LFRIIYLFLWFSIRTNMRAKYRDESGPSALKPAGPTFRMLPRRSFSPYFLV
jgi:hypothetical protein